MKQRLSMAARFMLAVAVIAALFTLAGAEPARGMSMPLAFGFWVLSVGAGLGLAVAAAAGLARWPGPRRLPRWPAIGVAGVVGLLLYLPLSLGLESAFAGVAAQEIEDGWLDRLEAAGGVYTLLAEALQAGPLYLATWALLNLTPAVDPASTPSSALSTSTPSSALSTSTPPSALSDLSASPALSASPPLPAAATADAAEPPAPPTRQLAVSTAAAEALGWPPALGDAVLSVRADLHYLHVATTLGRATVLGSLAAVESHFGAEGLRIHRSHWVARRAIRRIAPGADGWRCELHDGQRLPISRRRVAEVRALLGRDFVLDAA